MTLQTVQITDPINIGYDWAGTTITFPDNMLSPGDSVRATLGGGRNGFELTSTLDGDVITLSADEEDTAGLEPVQYHADLILVLDGVEYPLDVRLTIPVHRPSTEAGS